MSTDASEDLATWRALVTGVLRRSGRIGADDDPDAPEDLLTRTSGDGLVLDALYRPAPVPAGFDELPGRAPYVRGGSLARDETGWQVRQRVDERDAGAANVEALAELASGSTSLWVAVGGADRPAATDLPRVLDGVLLDLAPVVLEPHDDALAAARGLLDLAAGVDPASLRLQFGLDPLGELARRGAAARPGLSPSASEVSELLGDLPAAPGVLALVADALPFHEAGATDVEELGLGVAAGIAHLRELADAGVDPAVTAARIEFRWAATTDQFATVAKLRAARLLWHDVLRRLGVTGQGQRQHAVTSTVMTTRRDPWVNLLRTTVAAFAAGVGGADAVTVLPHDVALGRSGRSSRRLARTVQSLLVMEGHVARVRDPAGGSAAVEARTLATAEAAWEVVREVERGGGLRAGLEDGSVRARLATTWARRRSDVARGLTPVLGVTQFANLDELPAAAAQPEVDRADGLPVVRLAEGVEALRDRADAAGERPSVPVVVVGDPRRAAARVAWVSGVLATGGVRADETTVESLPPDAVVVMMVPAEADGPTAAALQQVRDAGTRHVVVAGAVETLPGADVGVAEGDDLVALLTDLLDRLGVPT